MPWVLMGRTVNLDPGSKDEEAPEVAVMESGEEELLKVRPLPALAALIKLAACLSRLRLCSIAGLQGTPAGDR